MGPEETARVLIIGRRGPEKRVSPVDQSSRRGGSIPNLVESGHVCMRLNESREVQMSLDANRRVRTRGAGWGPVEGVSLVNYGVDQVGAF